ncbi:predicted protein [Nematostella vectensis]|uniref:G-protein coupled receptors family 1 profile domain-containing protein n=1 Tax=Nematostella vectensis TaxID=45351 RepID=A7SAY6_NEMVE|nr:predicted protein [Nematostella vectensis]|eukprot:XP_001631194.1 predicted protein [Nematostella vectensis]
MNGSLESLAKLQSVLSSRSNAQVAFEAGLFVIIFITTVVGNSLTIFIVIRNKSLRTIPNMFVISLAVADLGMGCLSMHLLVTVLITSEWIFGELICQYQGFISILMAASSTQTLAWTAVNRFFSVCKSQKYRKIFSWRNTTLIMASIWGLSLLAPLPYVVSGNRFVFNAGKFFCYLDVKAGWFTGFLVAVYVGISTNVIFYCYFRVFKSVREHKKKLLQSRETTLSVEEIKITRTLFVIVVVFMLCWGPVLIMDFIDTFSGDYTIPREGYTAYTFLASLSSAVNAVIYGIMNPKFKKEYLRIMLCKTLRGVPVETTVQAVRITAASVA